jgi:hypothetical protein
VITEVGCESVDSKEESVLRWHGTEVRCQAETLEFLVCLV